MALGAAGVISSIGNVLYMKAIKHSDLSITLPLLAFTPLFLLVTSPLMIGEFPNTLGLIGVFLIITGSYTLNIKERHNGYLAPFRALLKEKGPRLMFIVAFLWSIGANFDKMGILNSSPLFWVIVFNATIATILLPIVLYKSPQPFKRQLPKAAKFLLLIGFISALSLSFQMSAVSLTLVIYVNAIKRTSTVIGVLFGDLFFKEDHIRERLAGALIMLAGVFFIAWA